MSRRPDPNAKNEKKIFIFKAKTLVGVLIATAVVILTGVFFYQDGLKDKSRHADWIENESIISRLTSDKAYVDHTVDGFTYKYCQLNSYSTSYYINKKIMIKYNPNDPYTVMTADTDAIFFNIGIAALTIGSALPFIYAGGAGLLELYKKKTGKDKNDPNKEVPRETYTNNQ